MSNVFPLDPRNTPPTPIPPAPFLGQGSAAPALAPEEDEDESYTVSVNEDGSVDVVVGEAEDEEDDEPGTSEFDANLVEEPKFSGAIAAVIPDLIEGIEADIRSRDAFTKDYITGLSLLGLQIDDTTESAGLSGAYLSRVRHGLLLESCLTFQARARGEILPADGPAKIRNDGDDTADRDQMASDLEEDLNHFLTTVATEYYPDTDRGLFLTAFGGSIHKKVYRCLRRKRPVSEMVELPDLIVSNDATDIDNAARVTHRIVMPRAEYREMVRAGVYADEILPEAMGDPSPTERKMGELSGIAAVTERPKDQPYTIYETYAWLDLGEGDDGPLPYKVSVEKDSKRVLECRRNWKEDDEERKARKRFVKWPFIPGPGYLDLGYLHIIGQDVKALTAIERILIDAGMFANFPGGVKLSGGKTDPNQIRPQAGEWIDIEGSVGNDDIRKMFMPLPYNGPNAELVQLWDKIEQNARRKAGAVEIETGEGRTNVPVGTIMAQIEQQQVLMTGVHKRLHQAQQEELMMMRDLFMEDPKALTRGNPRPRRTWTFDGLADLSFVPASDPNVPAQMHRVMLASAMIDVAAANPELYDQRAVHQRAWQAVHVSDIDSFLLPPAPAQEDDGSGDMVAKLAAAQLEIESLKAQAAQTTAQARMLDAQSKPQEAAVKAQSEQARTQAGVEQKAADIALDRQRLEADQTNAEADRASKEGIAAMNAETTLIVEGIRADQAAASPDPVHDDKSGP